MRAAAAARRLRPGPLGEVFAWAPPAPGKTGEAAPAGEPRCSAPPPTRVSGTPAPNIFYVCKYFWCYKTPSSATNLHHLLYLLLELLLYLLHGGAVVSLPGLVEAGEGAPLLAAHRVDGGGLDAVPEHAGLTPPLRVRGVL